MHFIKNIIALRSHSIVDICSKYEIWNAHLVKISRNKKHPIIRIEQTSKKFGRIFAAGVLLHLCCISSLASLKSFGFFLMCFTDFYVFLRVSKHLPSERFARIFEHYLMPVLNFERIDTDWKWVFNMFAYGYFAANFKGMAK